MAEFESAVRQTAESIKPRVIEGPLLMADDEAASATLNLLAENGASTQSDEKPLGIVPQNRSSHTASWSSSTEADRSEGDPQGNTPAPETLEFPPTPRGFANIPSSLFSPPDFNNERFTQFAPSAKQPEALNSLQSLPFETVERKALPAAISQLSIEIPVPGSNGDMGEKIQLRFSQRNSELNLGIEANSGDLNLELRDALPELVQKLGTGGWHPDRSQETTPGNALDPQLTESGGEGQNLEFSQRNQQDHSNEESNSRDMADSRERTPQQREPRRDRRSTQQNWNRAWDNLAQNIERKD